MSIRNKDVGLREVLLPLATLSKEGAALACAMRVSIVPVTVAVLRDLPFR